MSLKRRTPGGEYEVIGLEEPAEEYRVIRCRREDTEERCTILEFQDETLIRKLLPLFYELYKSASWDVCQECFVSDGKLCVVLEERDPGERASLRKLLEAFYEQADTIPEEGDRETDAVQELYRMEAEPDEESDGAGNPDEEPPEPAAKAFRKRLSQWFRRWESVIQVVLFLIVYTAVVLLLLYGLRELKGIGEREKAPRYQTIGTLDIQ